MTLIPFDDRDGFIWIDGEMRPWREAKIHFLTHSLHYGGAVFEGLRVYNERPFKLTEHSERLKKSVELLDFEIPYTVEELDKICMDVVKANNITDGYMRPAAWRGSGQFGIAAQEAGIHVAVACWEWPKYFKAKSGGPGVALQTSKWRRPDPRTVPVQSKAAGLYMMNTVCKHAADDAGYDDALLLDLEGRVAESTGANFFMVRDGVLQTPPPDVFLNGITRQTVMDLAREMGMEVQEVEIWPEDLKHGTEAFLTGSAAEITPIGSIDEITYDAIGAVTQKIIEAYDRVVREG